MKLSANFINIGYLLIPEPYSYKCEGVVYPGFSLTTERKIPNYDVIYNDGNFMSSISALREALSMREDDYTELANEIFALNDKKKSPLYLLSLIWTTRSG